MSEKKKCEKSLSVSQSSTEAKEEEDRWVFDSLVGFLTGPIWNMPLVDFLESKCCEFELPEGNPEVYQKIHQEYKHLVDLMLNSFMQDMGISVEQFEKACINARSEEHSGLASIRQTLLQQICAAEDIDVFIHMMVQKNNELQMQTLHYLQNLSQPKDEKSEDAKPQLTEENDQELQYVIRRSLQEHEELIAQIDKENEEINRILVSTLEEEKRRLEEENKIEFEMLNRAIKLSLIEIENQDTTSTSFKDKPETDIRKSPSPIFATCTPAPAKTIIKEENVLQNINLPKIVPKISSDNSSTNETTSTKNQEVSEAEIAKRRAYLKQQRDKIVAMKRSVRKMKMDQLEEGLTTKQRPKSAKTAKNALDSNNETEDLNPDILAARQALAKRLKNEVVTKDLATN